ncbi:hypothetical protein G6L37_06575 [Agrobacterium rubi]|nr:hypothetical protein [Agrobacterium rubi]NTF25028.1 hypothetical protein [Agrobacterium rubi]
MAGETDFVTITQAVDSALSEWASDGVSVDDMEMMVDGIVSRAIAEWQETPAEDRLVSVSISDWGTISGAVLNAMTDWHSAGTNPADMVWMAEDFALTAIEDWKTAHTADMAPAV